MLERGEQQRASGCSPGDGLKGFAATEAVAQWTLVDCWNFRRPLILHSSPVRREQYLCAPAGLWESGLTLCQRLELECEELQRRERNFLLLFIVFIFYFFLARPPSPPPSHVIYFFHVRKKFAYFILSCSFWNHNVPERPMKAGRHGYICDVFLLSSQTGIKTCSFFLYEEPIHYRLSWELCPGIPLTTVAAPQCSQRGPNCFFFLLSLFRFTSSSCGRCGGEI